MITDVAHWVILLCGPLVLAYAAISVMAGVYRRMFTWEVSIRAWGGAAIFMGYVLYTGYQPMLQVSMALIIFGLFLKVIPGMWELVKLWDDRGDFYSGRR